MAEALRLADELDDIHTTHVARNAAAELRRLHELLEAEQTLHQRVIYPELQRLRAQRGALLEASLRIESAVDWYLGRSSFTQTTQLKGLKHSANVRKELFAAHDEVRAAIKAVEEGK